MFILFHDNKSKSLNLIFDFLLDNPFVSKICVISESLEKEILHGHVRIIPCNDNFLRFITVKLKQSVSRGRNKM